MELHEPVKHSFLGVHDVLGVHWAHAPPMHREVEHLFVHAPQLFGSLAVFTHAPPHNVFEPVHVKPQPALVQDGCAFASVVLHTLPQVEQLFGSVAVFTHTPPQLVWLEAQQMPFEQIWPDVQAWLQVPQFFASVATVVQVPLHAVCPVEQVRQPVPLQKPLAHLLVAAVAQAPAPSQC